MKIFVIVITVLQIIGLGLAIVLFFSTIPIFPLKLMFLVWACLNVFVPGLIWFLYLEMTRSQSKLKENLIFHGPTGLPNRNNTVREFEIGVKSGRRHNYAYGIMLIGADKFSEVNSNFGQKGGDVLLKQIMERLKACIRGEDLIGHFEGDTFLLGCPHTDQKGMKTLSHRLVKAVRSHKFKAKGGVTFLSVSIGVYCSPPGNYDHDVMIHTARSNLKEAKKAGPGTVVL